MRKRINFRNWKKIVLVLFVLGIAFFFFFVYMAKAIDRVISPLISVQSTLMERLKDVQEIETIGAMVGSGTMLSGIGGGIGGGRLVQEKSGPVCDPGAGRENHRAGPAGYPDG